MRFSLREFICVTTLASLSVVAFYFANWLAQASFSLVAWLAMAAALITAMVSDGRARAVAIGFLAPQVVFATGLFSYVSDYDFSDLVAPVIGHVQALRGELVENDNGLVWLPFEEAAEAVAFISGTLMLGYIGAKYAAWLYDRKQAAAAKT